MHASRPRGPLCLYSGPRDVHSHRVRLVLAEKGVACEIVDVEPPDLPEDLMDLNPAHAVPTLADRGLVAYDDRVIIEYLDERYPHPPLMPGDPAGRAQQRVAMQRLEQDWYAPVTALAGRPGRRAAALRRQLRERVLAARPLFGAGRWLAGEDYSLLDCTVAPVLWRLPVLGIALPRGSEPLLRYAEAAFARPAFRRSLSPAESAMAQ